MLFGLAAAVVEFRLLGKSPTDTSLTPLTYPGTNLSAILIVPLALPVLSRSAKIFWRSIPAVGRKRLLPPRHQRPDPPLLHLRSDAAIHRLHGLLAGMAHHLLPELLVLVQPRLMAVAQADTEYAEPEVRKLSGSAISP